MAKTWQEVRDRMIEDYRKKSKYCPKEIIKMFKYDIIESGAGTFGTAFTTQVFVSGEIRYLGTYAATHIVAAADAPGDIPLAGLIDLYKLFIPTAAEFLSYCGLGPIWEWDKEVRSVFDQLETKEDFKDLVSAYGNVVSVYNGWIVFYFPWNMGDARRQRKPEEVREMAEMVGLL